MSASTRLGLDQETYRKLMRNLQTLPRKVMFKHVRIGMMAWGGVVKRKMQELAPKETGLLRRSIIVKARIPDASYNVKHHGKPAYAIVGPRRDLVRAVALTPKGFRSKSAAGIAKAHAAGKRVVIRRPSRYAHLVDRGTRKGVKATGFIRRAQNYGAGVGIQKLFDKLRQGIEQETAALAK